MRFLANENFPIASVRILRNAGHDIGLPWWTESAPVNGHYHDYADVGM